MTITPINTLDLRSIYPPQLQKPVKESENPDDETTPAEGPKQSSGLTKRFISFFAFSLINPGNLHI